MADNPVYLDYNATTPLSDRVYEAMHDAAAVWGNPSSLHQWGRRARERVDQARETLLDLLNAPDYEVVFTGSGTEANNLVIRSVVEQEMAYQSQFLCSSIEHSSVIRTFEALRQAGVNTQTLPVDTNAQISLDAVRDALQNKTTLLSVMWANNEVGTIQPIADLVQIVGSTPTLFHTDAVQAVGKIKVDLQQFPVDYLTLSAHKFYGPQGVGAILKKKSAPLLPQILGGGQEAGFRSGTENVVGIVGLETAIQDAVESIEKNRSRDDARTTWLRENLAQLPNTLINSPPPSQTVPNTVHLSFVGIPAETMMIKLDLAGFGVSTGSACSTGAVEPSHVLMAMGLSEDRVQSGIRISLGAQTTQSDLERFYAALKAILA